MYSQNYRLSSVLTKLDPDVFYDPSYKVIPYPNGDVDPKRGVCTDVVIRAYRLIGIDLQKEVHEDMKTNFSKYPAKWGKSEPDPNIDHRRVLNLMTFFERNGKSLPITKNPLEYRAGDIVCWELSSGIYHIGIVSSISSNDPDQTERRAIFHNIGYGQVYEDSLFQWKIIGHYVYPIPKEPDWK